MKEKETHITTLAVSRLLGVTDSFLGEIIEHNLVRPLRDPGSRGKFNWGKEEVLRAYLALDLLQKFDQKYGSQYFDYKYEQVRSEIFPTLRKKRDEILNSEGWEKVMQRAWERGIDLL